MAPSEFSGAFTQGGEMLCPKHNLEIGDDSRGMCDECHEDNKAAFGRGMRMPYGGTVPTDGSPYGDIPYAQWERFLPAGGIKK